MGITVPATLQDLATAFIDFDTEQTTPPDYEADYSNTDDLWTAPPPFLQQQSANSRVSFLRTSGVTNGSGISKSLPFNMPDEFVMEVDVEIVNQSLGDSPITLNQSLMSFGFSGLFDERGNIIQTTYGIVVEKLTNGWSVPV